MARRTVAGNLFGLLTPEVLGDRAERLVWALLPRRWVTGFRARRVLGRRFDVWFAVTLWVGRVLERLQPPLDAFPPRQGSQDPTFFFSVLKGGFPSAAAQRAYDRPANVTSV